MNAKIILAALAAICCMQAISAASLAQPLPWTELDDVEVELPELDDDFDFSEMTIEEIMEQLGELVDQLEEETSVEVNEHVTTLKKVRGPKNIMSCTFSIINLLKTIVADKKIFDEFQQNKKDYAAAKAACQAATPAPGPTPGPVSPKCYTDARAAFEAANKQTEAKVLPAVIKLLTSLFSLKSCLIPV